MTKKTLSKILLFGISTIAVTALLIVSVFYSYYQNQAKNNIVDVANLMEYEIEQSGNYDFINAQLDSMTRVTLLSDDATVIADSARRTAFDESNITFDEIKSMAQENSRPEIRKSDTSAQNTYYYAKLLDDGNILVASTKSQSILGVIGNVCVYILIIILFVVVCSIFISMAITRSILSPIEELGKNLDHPEKVKSYKEFEPFVNALKEQNKKQKALDKQKKQFTANVSHELKTPLTSIAGYAELIETGIAKEPDIKPFAATIRKQALRLVTLSEDIIQLSQLEENDEKDIAFSDTDIYEIARRCVEALSINAQTKGVSMTLEGESTLIKGNPSLIEELIYNLCDNAIRYNKPDGSVNVKIESDEKKVKLSVTDTGIGIDKKYRERIFERFFRVDKSRSKATGGTGLGLAIVKHIAQIHDAQINVDSVLGEGTSISVLFDK